MPCGGKHVHCTGPDGPVTQLSEPLHVPAQRGGVAGDIHHPLRPHGRDGADHLRRQPFPGRVHGDDVRPQALRLQPCGCLSRVAAEEFRVFNVVPGGVLFGVPDGRRHDLRADDPSGPLRQAQCNGADAAVQVQHRLPPRQAGIIQGLAVQRFRLIPVHLVKGGHRQLELQAAEGVHQIVPPPEGAVPLPQNHVAPLRVAVHQHSRGVGHGGADIGGQLRLPGGLPAVDYHTAKALALPVHPDVHVAHQSLSGGLVVGGDLVAPHPLPHRRGGFVRRLGLDQAPLHRHHLMGPGPVEADGAVRAHGVLALVAVVEGVLRPQDLLHPDVCAPQAGQGVLDPLALGPQLLGVRQVLEVAPAAPAVIGALGLGPVGRGLVDLHDLPCGGGLHHLGDFQVDGLPPDGLGDEHHGAVQADDAQTLAGVGFHRAGVDAVFMKSVHRYLQGVRPIGRWNFSHADG